MAANTNPTFPLAAHNESVTLAAANTNTDGTTGAYSTLFTPGAQGSRLDYVKVRHLATNVQTVLRLFRNTHLFMERKILANTISQSDESVDYIIQLDLGLAATSDVITCTIGTAVTGLKVTAVGGDY